VFLVTNLMCTGGEIVHSSRPHGDHDLQEERERDVVGREADVHWLEEEEKE
jgi:hypothetical protein